MYKIVVPIRVKVTKRKWFNLNLNQYRNLHYFLLNKAKKEVEIEVRKQIHDIPLLDHVFILYILYPRTKHKIDIMNVTSVADKFMCDALVKDKKHPNKSYILLDDNKDIVCGTASFFGSIDSNNPRVEAYIIPLRKKMKLKLDPSDIKTAVVQFVSNMIGANLVEEDVVFVDDGVEVEFNTPTPSKSSGVPTVPNGTIKDTIEPVVAPNDTLETPEEEEESKSIFG